MHVEVHDLGLSILGLDDHRAELVDPERRAVRSSANLTEEHRAGRLQLDQHRNGGEDRSEDDQPEHGRREVERALEDPRRTREPRRPEAHERDPLECVHLGACSEDLEEPRHDVDLDVEVADRADVGQDGLVRVVRERDDHALDVVLHDVLAQPLGPAEKDRQPLGELVVELGGSVVDEPDEADPVLAVIGELQRELLPDLATADDDGVLRVAREAAGRARGLRREGSG